MCALKAKKKKKKEKKGHSRSNMLAAITSLMDNVNCLLNAVPTLSPQPAIKAKLPKVRLTDRLTDLQITVCLCNPRPFFYSPR